VGDAARPKESGERAADGVRGEVLMIALKKLRVNGLNGRRIDIWDYAREKTEDYVVHIILYRKKDLRVVASTNLGIIGLFSG
jgi:hypothetical protein